MMQIYDIILKPPNFYTLFCYPEITFYTVVAHTRIFLTIPKKKLGNVGNLKVSLDGDSNTFNNIWRSPDVVIPTSRRGKYYVGTQELLRGDVGKRGKGGGWNRDRRWNRLELGPGGDIGRERV